MSERDDGGPAYPNTVKVTDEEYAELRGMSLRDAAAIEAMKALIQCAHGPNGGWQHITREDLIGEAFLYADAFLKARKS